MLKKAEMMTNEENLKCTENKAIRYTLQQRKGKEILEFITTSCWTGISLPTLLHSPKRLYNVTLQNASSTSLHLPTLLMVVNSKLISNAPMPQPGKIRHFQGSIPVEPCWKDQHWEEALKGLLSFLVLSRETSSLGVYSLLFLLRWFSLKLFHQLKLRNYFFASKR